MADALDNAIAELAGLVADEEVAKTAMERYHATSSYQSRLETRYKRNHWYYAPLNGDQWPEDAIDRPEKIHITVNIFRSAVNVDARLQAILPRISQVPTGLDEVTRKRAEAAEKMILAFLEMTDWEVWFGDLTRTKALYGKGVLKAFWNTEEGRPDVEVVENPANLRIGWGSSNFKAKDWALYEYTLSPLEAMQQFPDIEVHPVQGSGSLVVQRRGLHTDPLGQKPAPGKDRPNLSSVLPYEPSDYENKHVRVWDYWFKTKDGLVRNAVLVEGKLARDISDHSELPDIPFIVIENDHEPGSPEGIPTAEEIIDIQLELNRTLSHWAQLVNDEIDPAWQLNGENADAVPGGIVPKGGEIIAAGSGNQINPIAKPVNQFPIEGLIKTLWETFHRVTGLSEVLFGQMPGAQTSGRALAVQIEAAANRMDPKRIRLYAGLRTLLRYWTFMIEKANPKVELPDGTEGGLRDVFVGLRRWKVVAPEITPRDVIENTTNEINKVQAKLSSLRTSMDQLGIDSPEDELQLIQLERSNAHLFPGDVQSFVAAIATISQILPQLQAMMQQGGLPDFGLTGGAQGQLGAGAAQQDAFEAQPTLAQEDNQAGPPQPATGPGSAPPAGATAPLGATGTTLIRSTPEGGAQALQQTAITRPL